MLISHSQTKIKICCNVTCFLWFTVRSHAYHKTRAEHATCRVRHFFARTPIRSAHMRLLTTCSRMFREFIHSLPTTPIVTRIADTRSQFIYIHIFMCQSKHQFTYAESRLTLSLRRMWWWWWWSYDYYCARNHFPDEELNVLKPICWVVFIVYSCD